MNIKFSQNFSYDCLAAAHAKHGIVVLEQPPAGAHMKNYRVSWPTIFLYYFMASYVID